MNPKTVAGLLLAAVLLGPTAAFPSEAKAWKLTRVSTPGRLAKESRLIVAKHGLYLAWVDEEHRRTFIAPYDSRSKAFEKFWQARFRSGSDFVEQTFGKSSGEEMLPHYDVRVGGLMEDFQDTKNLPRGAFFGVARRFFLLANGPLEFLSVRVVPHVNQEEYELVKCGQVIANENVFDKSVEEGGLYRQPDRYCLLRRSKGGGAPLFLAVSDPEQIWSSESPDGGKTWVPHRTIVRDRYCGDVVETATGELLLFCLKKGHHLQLMRSKDGKEWSQPETIFPEVQVGDSPAAYVNPDGHIWLTFSVGTESPRHVVLTRSTDHGKTWARLEQVTLDKHNSVDPSLAIYDEELLIAFTRFGEKGQKNREIWTAVKELYPKSPKKDPEAKKESETKKERDTKKEAPTPVTTPATPEDSASLGTSRGNWGWWLIGGTVGVSCLSGLLLYLRGLVRSS